jgi:hypothetical protein
MIVTNALPRVPRHGQRKPGSAINKLRGSVHLHTHEEFCGRVNTSRQIFFMVTIAPSALNGRYLAQIAAVIFIGPAGRVVRGRTQW